MAPREIAETLKRWREARGLSQRALAERAGMPYPMVARIELGQTDPRLSTLRRLAEALKLTVGDLVDGTPNTGKRPGWKRARGK
jgi:transcriptional regulator with XRE-family HTH domain